MALPFAITEAYRSVEFFAAHLGIERAEVDVAPTRATVLTRLGRAVAATRPGDTLVVTWSGHGASLDPATEAIVPDWATAPGQMVRDAELRAMLAKLPAGSDAIVVMDCCHSATMCNMRHTWTAADGRRTEDPRVAPLAARVVVIAASGQDQKGFDIAQIQQSLLGAALRSVLPRASAWSDLLAALDAEMGRLHALYLADKPRPRPCVSFSHRFFDASPPPKRTARVVARFTRQPCDPALDSVYRFFNTRHQWVAASNAYVPTTVGNVLEMPVFAA